MRALSAWPAALPVALALTACSGATSNAAADSPGAAPAAPAPSDCLASTTRARPPGWVDAGKLVVSVTDGKPTSIEVHDASGKVVKTSPVDASSPEASRESLRQAVCDAGGYLGVMVGKPPVSGSTTIAVVRPEKEDETGDIDQLCSEPKDIPADFDLSQRVVVARHMYEETLTSKRFRAWLHGMDRAIKGDDRAERVRRIDELSERAKAAGKKSCWFPDTLRQGAGASGAP